MINIESIKGKIRSLAEKRNLKSQEVLQIYFFERFLERLSKSQYKNNFVIKGGFLISGFRFIHKIIYRFKKFDSTNYFCTLI